MKNLQALLVIISIGLGSSLWAVPAQDITCERFPDADSVLVDELERVKYNADGTSETVDETWTKVLTEKGRREESSVTLHYSKRYGEASISYVGIISEDGTEREIDVSATTKEATDNGSMSSNIYDPLDRRIVCTVPGLKIGDIIHVRNVRRTLKARTKDKWADISIMEWSHPIIKSTFEVVAPADRPLKRIEIRHPLGNIIRSERKLADGSMVHTFTATNSAQVFPEPDMPPLYTQVQNVRVSTAEDWPEISRWYWDLCGPHLAKTNAAMVAKVNELTKTARTKQESIRSIFKFVSQEVRYMGLTLEDTSPGYAPHDVDVTFDNRYGVCRDKAGLLVAMLRLAGHKAFPVLIHAGAKLDPDVPQPFFNHAIVAVDESDRKYVLMDPTNENTKDIFPSYLCNCSYLVARPEGEDLRTTEVLSPEHNSLDIVSKGSLSKDGSLFLENDISFSGINDTAYRHALAKKQPEDRFKFFERIVKSMSTGAELIKCEVEPKDMRDTETPIRVRLSSRMPEMVLHGRTRDELTVPFMTRLFGMANFLLQGSTSLERRKYPLVIDTTARVSEKVEISVGNELGEIKELPPDMNLKDGYGYVRNFSVKDGVLKAERSLTIGAVEFPSDDYLRLREDIKRVEAAERKRPIFAKDKLKDADVRYLLDSVETTLISDNCWVTTNRVIKEILSYNGKKQSAELKFNYNPTWKQVYVASAVVSNRNGKVSAVTDKERNVMDCGWAASAPRYPAGKTLVVSLPSVEIGSVISYETVTVVSNAPAAFYATYSLDTYVPMERKFVRVNDWQREILKPDRLPDEPNQPMSWLWRDQKIISRGNWGRAAERLLPAVDVDAVDPECLGELHVGEESAQESLLAIRNWMARNVKIAGPGLYDVPLAQQLTDPIVVLKERYATRLDYIRTLCALLRGAGYKADVVLASLNEDEPECIKRRNREEFPNEGEFSTALCRVEVVEGGFLGIGCDRRTFFIGIENQYAQLGAVVYAGSEYFDPKRCMFGIVTVPSEDLKPYEIENRELIVRENGSVDMTVEDLMTGPSVASFRKTYAEILPEDRSRKFQSILGGISQAASATSELETDVESYPARRKFSCYIPDFATVAGDTITLQVPSLSMAIPSMSGTVRKTPFSVKAKEGELDRVTIRFPEGYTLVEHLPGNFVFSDPSDPNSIWIEGNVSSQIKDGSLEVRIVRKVHKRGYSWFEPKFYELIKDWDRIESSRANRAIVVRKVVK